MNKKPLNSFFGFAIIVDLRNFSEIGRRLLIQKKKPFSNSLKSDIYDRFFNFLTDVLEILTHGDEALLFDYKHTGDGFLFLTKHDHGKRPDALDSFLLLLNTYKCLSATVQNLNQEIIKILKNDPKVVRGNKQLRYIKSLFRNDSGRGWKQYIGFSVGAHCGTIFYKTYGEKKLFLGNTINQAARFQSLSTTFSDYNLFFSEGISTVLKDAIKEPSLYTEMASQWFRHLERIEIKGLGPTSVQTIRERHVEKVRESLLSIRPEKNKVY